MKSLQSNSSSVPATAPAQPASRLQKLLMAGLTLMHSLLSHLDSKTRLGLCLMVGMAVFLIMPDSLHLDIHILAGWISGVLLFFLLIVLMISSASAQKTRYRAQRQEAQHLAVFLLVVITACTSIFAIATVLAKNKDSFMLEVGLSLAAIVCSWLLMHTMFVLHYAAAYYRRDPGNPDRAILGGLQFTEAKQPDYLDFVYFTFTLGMTSQTSDTAIVTAAMRRLTLGHTLVSFYFYSVILALSVSIVSRLI